MKVAIIGAGLAGLSCAHEFEKYGIKPVIYERNSFIGEQFPHVGATLEVISRPIRDAEKYLKDELGLFLKPLNTVNSVIHRSPNKATEVKGNLGYFFERSKEPNDIKVQLYSSLKQPHILFNTAADYEQLSKKYDHVVVADGRFNPAKELGCWREWLNTYIRGAVVLGDFDPNTLIVWLNKDYCKNGYAYLTPFNDKKASIVLVVSDVNEKEIDHYWEVFLYTENIKYSIIEEYKQMHNSGFVYPHRVGNIFLAGNAGGAIDPFLGFGVLASMTMGVMAARSIAESKDYEKLIADVTKRNIRLHEFRKALNKLSNGSYDSLITSIGLPGIKQFIYYTPVNAVKYGASVLRLINKTKN